MARSRGYRKLVEADLDIMPLMNLFVVLIPMLLLSAVFVELSSIDMQSPSTAAEEPSGPQLDLALALSPSQYTVTGRGLRRTKIDREEAEADERLREVLRAIAQKHPKESGLRIESPAATAYQELITAMDISRSVGLSAISLVGNSDAGSDLQEAR